MVAADTSTTSLARATVAGQFTFCNGAGDSLLPRGRKAVGIVAVLLWRRGKKIHREELSDLFWSDRAREQGMASLRKSLTELRFSFGDLAGPLLDVDRQYASLRADRIDVDLWDPDGHARLDAARPLLEGIGPIAPAFDDWIEARRREFRDEQVRAAERRMRTAEPGSDAALRAAEALLALEPENEAAARTAIVAHGARGNLARARRIFEELGEALRGQGFEVSASTRAALDTLRERDATRALARPRPPASVPTPAGPPALAIGSIDHLGPDDRQMGPLFTMSLANRAAAIAEFRAGIEANLPEADFLLSGIAVPDGDRLHLTIGVTARAGGEQLASIETAADVSAPITGIAVLVDRVIARILPAIERDACRRLPADTSGWTAYHHYLQARRLIATADGPGYMDVAQPHLEQAVRLQPDFLPPYPYLISSLNSGGRGTRPGMDLTEARQRAMALTRKFLMFDAQNPNAHLALAWCLMRSREFDLAEQSLIEAERLRPYDAHRINSLGNAFVLLGDHEKGERYYRLARELMVNDLDFMNTDWGELHYFRRDYAAALPFLSIGEMRNPAFPGFLRAATLAQLGRLDEARKEAARTLGLLEPRWSGPEPFSPRAAVRWFVGDFPMRRQIDLDNLREGLAKAGFTL